MTSSPILRGVFLARSADQGCSRSRARGALGVHMHKIQCRQIRASDTFRSVAATILPVGGGKLRRSVEPTRTTMAPLLRTFSRGLREILNFCRAFEAAGKPFLGVFRARHVCQDFACDRTDLLQALRSAP